MCDVSVEYMGLKLRSPFVVASSPLSSSSSNFDKIENSGAGAVVLKSIFEEQIESELGLMLKDVDEGLTTYLPEYFETYGKEEVLSSYLDLISDAKKSLSIPVVASLNCVSGGDWIDYAKRVEAAGADALEVNIFILPSDWNKDSSLLEDEYVSIIKSILQTVSIPVSVKLGMYFTGMANFLKRLEQSGVKSIVLFNRLQRQDIDIDNLKIKNGTMLSSEIEISHSLRWIALMSGEMDIDLVASTGVHSCESAIKQLLVGANSVQLCTVLLKNGVDIISKFIEELKAWMLKNSFKSISDFKGKLAQESISNPKIYERVQYIKSITGK